MSTINCKVNVFIEIEKNSNIKYEFNKEKNCLEIDRILPEPYYYPFAYGFIPNTLAMDGDDLDILVITNKNIKNNNYYNAYIIGVLIMEDENGMDEKVLCVLEEDYDKIKNMSDLDQKTKENITWFFANYKNESPNKWSKVIGYEDKQYAIDLYNKFKV